MIDEDALEEMQDKIADAINEALDKDVPMVEIIGTLAMTMCTASAGSMLDAMGYGETKQ